MSFLKRRNQAGMTLPEIMITIGILGVLASLAVSSFSNLQRRQRKSEAKALLIQIHGQMVNFEAAWGAYWGRFLDIPFAPAGMQTYNVGFDSEGTAVPALPDAVFVPAGSAGQINSIAACGNDIPGCAINGARAMPLTMGGCSWQEDQFTACAEGDIGGTQTDQWSIDEVKTLQNIRDGAI